MEAADFGGMPRASVGERVAAAVAADGTAAHPYVRALAISPRTSLADLVHHLCTLHGRRPGLIDQAAERLAGTEPAWADAATGGFAAERTLLARLAVGSGAVPSTPGQRESEAAATQQRHALETLGASDREGCALGAAAALILDWAAIRAVLDRAAIGEGLFVPRCELPSAATLAMLDASPEPWRRAIGFGADQLLAQHRGMWTLLAARQSARESADRLAGVARVA